MTVRQIANSIGCVVDIHLIDEQSNIVDVIKKGIGTSNFEYCHVLSSKILWDQKVVQVMIEGAYEQNMSGDKREDSVS